MEKTTDFISLEKAQEICEAGQAQNAEAITSAIVAKPDVTPEQEIAFEAEEEVKDQEEAKKIHYTILGGEDCPVAEDDEEVDYCMQYRIPKIEGVSHAKQMRSLLLRKNLIKKIEGLEENLMLEEIELYDNRIRHITNIEHLTNLTHLDLSFNRLKEMQNLETLVNLKKLYLSSNRIRKMEGLNTLINLDVLDVGDNRIRKIENIDKLVNLKEFHAAKNKITVLEGLQNCTQLYLIAIQVNFIYKIEGLETLTELTDLYMQQNQVKKIEGLQNNLQLDTLDLAMNKVTKFEGLEHLSTNGSKTLNELWINWNYLEDTQENKDYLKQLRTITTIYLADNPMSQSSDYQEWLTAAIPELKQIDGNMLRVGNPFYHQRTEGIHSSMKQKINPEAQAILASVLPEKSTEEKEESKQE